MRDRGYLEHTIKNFDGQSGLLHLWSIKETDLLKDIELWSGKKAVALRGVNQGGRQVALTSFGVSEQARPLLQAEDILATGEGKQLTRTNDPHLYLIDRASWFTASRWANALTDVRTMVK